jgi:phosphoglycolate phosphatase
VRVEASLRRIYFDLDGPIIDVAPKFYQLYTQMFSSAGYPVLPFEEYWSSKRSKIPEDKIALRTAPADFVKGYVVERVRVIENTEYLQYDALIPGAVELLDSLQPRQELVLVTLRNRRENLMWELRHFDLEKYFRKILTKEDNHGDHRIKIELISAFCGSEPPAGMIVGDTESDIRAGQELGLTTVAVTCGIRTKEYLQALRPDYIIDSMNQLSNLIASEGA